MYRFLPNGLLGPGLSATHSAIYSQGLLCDSGPTMTLPRLPLRALVLGAAVLATPLFAQAPGGTRDIGPVHSGLLVPSRLGGFASRAIPVPAPQQQVLLLQGQGWGTGFGVEAFGGTLKPRDAYHMPEQDLGGVLAGFQFGRDL